MEIRRAVREELDRGFGLDYKLLLPWPELNAPFEGAYCIARAGDSSMAHDHHEYEIFIALSGAATVVADGERSPFTAGDIVHFTPGVHHQVVNESDEDFVYYCIWWDTAMSERFAARHRGEVDSHGN